MMGQPDLTLASFLHSSQHSRLLSACSPIESTATSRGSDGIHRLPCEL